MRKPANKGLLTRSIIITAVLLASGFFPGGAVTAENGNLCFASENKKRHVVGE